MYRLTENKDSDRRGDKLISKIEGRVTGIEKVIFEIIKSNLPDTKYETIKEYFNEITMQDLTASNMIPLFMSEDKTVEFYFQNMNVIDQALRDIEYFSNEPVDSDVDTIRSFIVDGTISAVSSAILTIKELI